MALERTSSGDIPVERLLAQLRRAAEQDGVEDVDALVAEFATYVRAQAPRLASRHSMHAGGGHSGGGHPGSGRGTGGSKSTAFLAVSAVLVLAFGATVSGAIPNLLLPESSTSSNPGSATAEGTTHDSGSDEADPSTPAAGAATRAPDAGPVTGQPDVAVADLVPLFSTDPDALAVLAEQRSEAPTPAAPTLAAPTPAAPGTPNPVAITGPVDAADAASTATTDSPDPAAGTTTTTTTTTPATTPATTTATVSVIEPFSLGGSGPEIMSPLTDEGDAG